MVLNPQGNHHRRRSSIPPGVQGPSQNRYSPVITSEEWESSHSNGLKGNGPREEERSPLISEYNRASDVSSTDDGTDVELNLLPSDEEPQDEGESGLSANQRKRRILKRKKKRQRPDAQIPDVQLSGLKPHRLADKNLVRRLTINAGLIGLWYIFSLSISVVSSSHRAPIKARRLSVHFH
jgi:solute carrier family 35, member C2